MGWGRSTTRARIVGCLILAVGSFSCGSRDDGRLERRDDPAASAPVPFRADRRAAGPRPRIVFLGDSLTAGLGLAVDEAYPSVLARRLRERGFDYEIVNAGVSGD